MTQREAEIEVTVILALPDRATELAVSLPAGATLADALERSGLAARHPEVDLSAARVGIFGKLAKRDTLLASGDRVEVYRALVADPRARRLKTTSDRSKTGCK
jgi:uncharacterized protein